MFVTKYACTTIQCFIILRNPTENKLKLHLHAEENPVVICELHISFSRNTEDTVQFGRYIGGFLNFLSIHC